MSGKRDAPVTRTNLKNQFQSFDQPEIISKQKLLQTKYHEALSNQSIQYFQKMKYNGFIYQIGQFVELFHYKSKAPYVAKINKIIKVKQQDQNQNSEDIQEQVPFLEVEWYMNKSELSQEKITSQYFQCLSNSQVFASGNIFYIYIESIISKCQVLNFQQYWNISQSSPGIYFTRAAYNPKTKLLNPSPTTWKKFCYCSSPYNPDVEFVQCQTCHEWIHSECDPQQFLKEQFICKKCRSKQKPSKKK